MPLRTSNSFRLGADHIRNDFWKVLGKRWNPLPCRASLAGTNGNRNLVHDPENQYMVQRGGEGERSSSLSLSLYASLDNQAEQLNDRAKSVLGIAVCVNG